LNKRRYKMLLIQPRHKSNVKIGKKVYMSTLTLPVVASLTPENYDVDLLDENVERNRFDGQYDIVGITAMTGTATRAYEIADRYRKMSIPVILGGVHPTLMPDDAIPHADAIVMGEAEGVWHRLLADFEKGKLQKIYRNDKKPDLTGLPIPRRELLKNKLYLNIPKVETSRGCPFDCSFCSTTKFFGRGMRYRPVEEVVEELKRLKKMFVFFTDNNIVGNVAYAKKLFKALIPLKIRWLSQGSINMANDDELIRLAKKSGCQGMLIGFESISDNVIKNVGKGVNKIKEYEQQIKKLHKHRIGIIGCFVLGFDEEDEGIFQRTLNFIKKTRIEMPQLTLLTPFPGTRLREFLEKEGRILHNFWEKYDTTHVVFKPYRITVEELRKQYDWLSSQVYSKRAIFVRIMRSFRYHWRQPFRLFGYWRVNIVYRLLWRAGSDGDY